MMDRQALDRLVSLSQAAGGIKTHPALHDHVLVGETLVKVPSPHRAVRLLDIPSLQRFVGDPMTCPRPEVYVGPDRIDVACDGADLRDRGTLEILSTGQMALIHQMCAGGIHLDPKQVRPWARLEFEGVPPEVVSALSAVQFESTHTVDAQHAGLSESARKKAQGAGGGAIPESFMVEVYAFRNDGLEHLSTMVEVKIEVDKERRRFSFHVSRAEDERMHRELQKAVCAKVTSMLVTPASEGEPRTGPMILLGTLETTPDLPTTLLQGPAT